MRTPLAALLIVSGAWPSLAAAQATQPVVPLQGIAPPPATKLEAFKPAAGSLVTLAYDELGIVGLVSVDVRELRAAGRIVVRGLLVQVFESQYRIEPAFVDADEIPELIRGIDALLEVKSNPTSFKKFEVRYTTKGGLGMVAYNTDKDAIEYSIQAGRVTFARWSANQTEVRQFREMLATAQQKLKTMERKQPEGAR